MTWIVQYLWLIPVLPLLAAGITALMRQSQRKPAAALAIGSMGLGFVLSCIAFVRTLGHEKLFRDPYNIDWISLGASSVKIGWVLDPLTACMLVMVTFVGTLIFIFSVGYMAHDQNFTRFFCFLSLFAAAMLGLIISNSLLLLFMCWELVGLASYLLIGFWYHKPSAAAAAKKAFITTRIGDIGFFLGMLWLYHHTGTLLFYDKGGGCMEQSALSKLVATATIFGMAASTAIALLLFCGAMGKSGQFPLHVWLPDAMEGPTPVSALIHAATMVAAGVFMVARVYPLMSAGPGGIAAAVTPALQVVTWVGAFTAFFAAMVAVAQNDIKRILAYSTVSQLGYMMMGLGVGGVEVGMFHLITHAFFKALLFLGSGSVIHGCHEEQDIRHMGGLKKFMPVTFYTYAVGMLALAGFPFFFSGFWSKDEILHKAHEWPVSQLPFYIGLAGAALTAFYMTRQMCYVFYGAYRGGDHKHGDSAAPAHQPHESPSVMTVPLVILAVCAVVVGFIGAPRWVWFQNYLTGRSEHGEFSWSIISLSILVVAVGVGIGWLLYRRNPIPSANAMDVLERKEPALFATLRGKFYVDELYEATVIRFHAWSARAFDWLDRVFLDSIVRLVTGAITAFSWLSRMFDEYVINFSFDSVCRRVGLSGRELSQIQDGQVQHYLRVIGLALTVLVLLLTWGCGAP